MAAKIVRLIVDLSIKEGQLQQFEAVAREMAAATESEPGTLSYEFYLSADRKRCRIIESYVDGDAVFAHFTGRVVQELVPKLIAHCSLDSFTVNGDPGVQAAAMLANFGAQTFQHWYGFSR